MSHLVKVAELNELPPGKGKTIHVQGRDVTVYNREGRYVATSTWRRQVPAPSFETSCDMPGHKFDIGVADSPDRIQSDELRYQVVVEGGGVFVVVEEGHVHPGSEPRVRRRVRRRR